jgi:two-component system, sensor histidine kinase
MKLSVLSSSSRDSPCEFLNHGKGGNAGHRATELLSRRSILIVEDNADAAEVLRMVLELSGHHVRTATSGRQGIEQALAEPPDIALVDIGLPDIDGCEVGRTVRDQLGRGGVYLVALTGHSRSADRERALRSGFDSYLVKPVTADALRAVIAQAPAHRK